MLINAKRPKLYEKSADATEKKKTKKGECALNKLGGIDKSRPIELQLS